MTFTDAFYDAVFSNMMTICEAFINAQQVVNINNSAEQANIFKLLVTDPTKELKKMCKHISMWNAKPVKGH